MGGKASAHVQLASAHHLVFFIRMLLVHSSARVPRSAYRKVDRGSQQPAGINYYQLTTHVLPTTFSRKLIRLRNILTRPSIATAGRLVHSVYRDNPCRGVTSGPWNKRCRPGLSEVAAAEIYAPRMQIPVPQGTCSIQLSIYPAFRTFSATGIRASIGDIEWA